jgi:DNA gyrase subunit B
MDPEQLWDTTMDPERRTLLRVSVERRAAADRDLHAAHGRVAADRREWIEANARYADVDV